MTPEKKKFGFALLVAVLALAAGVYLSGFLALLFLDLNTNGAGLGTYYAYVKAIDLPQVAPYAGRIKAAGYIGFGLPLLAGILLLVVILKPRRKSLHGEARFANRGDLARAGLLKDSPEGIVIGKFGRELIRMGGTQHVIVTAPTRTGKTTSIAYPVLLTYGHSVVCMDLKGELFKDTSGYRQSVGQRVLKFAPYAEDGRTFRFNPFQTMSGDPRVRISEIQTIGAILYPDDPNKDPFWTSQSRTAFLAFALFLFENWDDMVATGFPGLDGKRLNPNTDPQFPSFERIYRFSSGHGEQGIKEVVRQLLASDAGSERKYISDQTRTAFSGLIGLAEETFSSVIATMQEPLQQFLSPILAAATNACDFRVDTLRQKPTTIYVVIPPHKLGESGKLLNIFFSTVVGQNLKVTPQEDESIKHQCLLLLDEFTAMGRVKVLSDRISLTAGYWVRDLSIIQSLSQLDSTYGQEEARTYITNHAASIVFTPREQRDANEYSEMLGYTTMRRRNRTVSRGVGGGNVSYAHTEERRALMLPQELKELSNDEQLIFHEGIPPIRCRKNWYFKDKFFTRRVMAPVEVPVLALSAQSVQSSTGNARR